MQIVLKALRYTISHFTITISLSSSCITLLKFVMKSTAFVLLQALALGALAAPAPKDTPPFNWHKGLTREQEGRELSYSG